MLNVTTYAVIYFNIIFFILSTIFMIIVSLFSIFFGKAKLQENIYKLMAFIMISYISIPFISFFTFGIYLGGFPAKFGAIPDYHKISQYDIFSMSYNGNDVPESQYLPTLKLVTDRYIQENEEILKRRDTQLDNKQ